MLYVYTDSVTARLEYVFQFILHTIGGFDVHYITNPIEYQQIRGATLNYSLHSLKEADFTIKPNGLLFQEKIVPLEAIIQKEQDNIELLLRGEKVLNHFDLFAASFYLIARYEEYTHFEADEHGRFLPTQSILYHSNLLQHPLIDAWAYKLRDLLLQRYPRLSCKQKQFEAFVTIDVDQAFAFRNRGFLKNGLSFIKNAITVNMPSAKSQAKTLVFNRQDPFDTFDYLKHVQENSNLRFIYFFNVGKASGYDKNLDTTNAAFAGLIKRIKQYADIGVHPSYYANEKPEYFIEELRKLSITSGSKIGKSRQHYLKFRLPYTYRQLLKAGIVEDYSMGYASAPGFRAGTCTPFYWFDLEMNEVSNLKVIPITYMEGTLGSYLKHSPNEAAEVIYQLTEVVKKYKGVHISIWHNHTVSDQFFWKGWRMVFENSIAALKNG